MNIRGRDQMPLSAAAGSALACGASGSRKCFRLRHMIRWRLEAHSQADRPGAAWLVGACRGPFHGRLWQPGRACSSSLNLPAVVTNLSATRVGGAVQLAWTMPARTTDAIVLKRPIRAEVCRKIGSGPCIAIATNFFPPGKPAVYVDHLSADLTSGAVRVLTYQIALRNHARKSAGPSNPAFSASGTAPAAIRGLAAEGGASRRRPAELATIHGGRSRDRDRPRRGPSGHIPRFPHRSDVGESHDAHAENGSCHA